MLFWSFVLAFVLSILYYLSPVHNVVQVEDKPVADTMISTFVNTHQAAKRLTYLDTAGIKKINKQCDGKCDTIDEKGNTIQVDCKVDCLDDKGKPIPIEVEDTSKRVITFTYKNKMLAFDDGNICGEAQSGNEKTEPLWTFCKPISREVTQKYNVGSFAWFDMARLKKFLVGDKHYQEYVDEYELTSAIACISNKSTSEIESTDPYLTFNCNGGSSSGIGDYVITYMRAPGGDETAARSELWRSGVLRRTKGSHECGILWKTQESGDGWKISLPAYTYDSDSNLVEKEDEAIITVKTRKKYDKTSPYILDNSRRFTVSIPKVIGIELEEYAKAHGRDDDNNGIVDFIEDMNDGYLLFCITPIDDIKASFEWKDKHGYGTYQIK